MLGFPSVMVSLRPADEANALAASSDFYEMEALLGCWSVRQLERQIESQLYELYAIESVRCSAPLLTLLAVRLLEIG